MITFSDFRRLRIGALDCADFDTFLAEDGGSVDMPDVDAGIDLLRRIYDCRLIDSSLSVRNLTGMSRAEFCRSYQIPLRTAEDWDAGAREPAPYIIELLLYAVLSDLQYD